jgi:hypothetical protein
MDEEEAEDVAFGLLLAVSEHLDRNADRDRVDSEEVRDFVNTTDRMALSRRLRNDPETPDEFAAVLGSRSDSSHDVFYKLREMCGGIEMIGTDPEKRAEVDELLAKLREITERDGPPAIDDLSTTEIAVNEPSYRIALSKTKEWLNSVEPQRFYSAWGSVPQFFEAELRNLIAMSDRSEVMFGSTIMKVITEKLTNTHSTAASSPTVGQWLNSISQTSAATFYESDGELPGSLFILDDYVIAGYFAREEWPMGAFLVTGDAAFHEWALNVYQDWREESRVIEMPIRFQG